MSSLFANKSLLFVFRLNSDSCGDQPGLVSGAGAGAGGEGTDDLMVKQLKHNIEQLAG